MSPVTHFVEPRDSLMTAREMMQAHGIRHLPVVEHRKVVGIVTLGDLFMMEAVMELDPDDNTVSDGMSQEIYCVEPDVLLAEVATEMAKRRIGSAMVVDGGELAGIFTSTDACRVLGRFLSSESGSSLLQVADL